MGLAISVLVIVLLMGSIFWVMPSAAQKRVMNLRQNALSMGLRPSVQRITRIREPGESEVLPQSLLLYSKLRQQTCQRMTWQLERREGFDPVTGVNGWFWKDKPAELAEKDETHLREILSQVPASVDLVLVSSMGVSLHWNEKNPELLSEINRLAESILAKL
ncbi:hypothetical protein ACKC9G_02660 [Pokkaliibacter sp. CJK22405]|uniref:hypothetical protein n=1 Tax=Pokkaliibacter sp. CJK22405 TaxID=3384615 RepID=UPI003985089A